MWSPADQTSTVGLDGMVVVETALPTDAATRRRTRYLHAALDARDLGEVLTHLRALVPDYTPSRPCWRSRDSAAHRSAYERSPQKRRIGVVTTSRADYSHLYWPLRELAAHPGVELGVFALGAHLAPEFGIDHPRD